MRAAVTAIVCLLSVAWLAAPALGQERCEPVAVTLIPVAPPGSPALVPLDVAAGSPALVPHTQNFDIGFEYIRPFWSNRGFHLSVPGATPSSPLLLGDAGDVQHDFDFVPKIRYEYEINDLGLGVQASGELLSLNATLKRTLTTDAGTGVLDASSKLEIVVANILEGTKSFLLKDLLKDCDCLEKWHVDESLVEVTIGTRYSSLHQKFEATLTNGPNSGRLLSTQDFTGIGLTSSLSFQWPIGGSFVLYHGVRGSLLIGDNGRDSTFTLTVPGTAGANRQVTLGESKTDLLPVGELEVGIAWGMELGSPLLSPAAAAPKPLAWVKVGLAGQIWGDAGMLSAAEVPPHLHDSNLYLVGFSVLVGFEH